LSGAAPGRRRLILATGLGALCAAARTRAGDADRALRLTVAYPPGGVSDDVARELARGLESRWGGPVVVDHRPGAGGMVALEALSRAPADGRTLCFCAITPLLHAPPPGPIRFDPARGIAPVAAVMSTPILVLATPAFEGNALFDVVAAGRAAPGRVRWATSGHATTGHLVLDQLRAAAGVDITHVPYTGGGRQITDALAGQFEVLSSNVASRQLALVQQGRLRALAVGAPRRLPVLPDVPTLVELGYPGANLWSVFGIFAPGQTPPDRLDELNRHINAVLRQPAFRQHLLSNCNLPMEGSRQEFRQLIATKGAAMRRVMEAVQRP
jgi:tripartite-type tricarboxylate transporter receptor subunit TctC